MGVITETMDADFHLEMEVKKNIQGSETRTTSCPSQSKLV